jgi:radical SAM superfamily enzyme YgiQ (UPF0313 family)
MVTSDKRLERLAKERGTLFGQGRRALALVYPSPYRAGMSSLGLQTVYRSLNALPDTVAERAFLPDDDEPRGALCTYESGRPAADFPVVAFSVAYELELAGMFTCLERMGMAAERTARGSRDPLVVAGGPLTFSNPVPLGPFADVVVLGEAEDLLAPLCDVAFADLSRADILRELAARPGFWVPSLHGEQLPAIAQCEDEQLPAFSQILTPDTALSDMFLVETERGCSRGCTFCVMRRSTNGGMRVVPVQRIIDTIPANAAKVGLVGAAVSDHPRIVEILRAIVGSGRGVSLSSLRADRLTPEFVELLVKGGGNSLTIASDGASERIRVEMVKKIKEKHIIRTCEMVRDAGLPQLKLYMMLGVPGETDADLDELIAFTDRMVETCGKHTRLVMGISTFVAKRQTPLFGAPFIGVRESERRIERVRRALAPRVEVRADSSRWAWVEHELARGGFSAGLAALQACRDGGRFADWKRAFAGLEPVRERRKALPVLAAG